MPYDKDGNYFTSVNNPNYTGTHNGVKYKNGQSWANGYKNSIDDLFEERRQREEKTRRELAERQKRALDDIRSRKPMAGIQPVYDPAFEKAKRERQEQERIESQRRSLIQADRVYWAKRLRLSGGLLVVVFAGSAGGFLLGPQGGPVNQLAGLALAASPFAVVAAAALFRKEWISARKSMALTAEKAAQIGKADVPAEASAEVPGSPAVLAAAAAASEQTLKDNIMPALKEPILSPYSGVIPMSTVLVMGLIQLVGHTILGWTGASIVDGALGFTVFTFLGWNAARQEADRSVASQHIVLAVVSGVMAILLFCFPHGLRP